VLIGKILTFVMTGIALVVVTRVLGPSQYGVYTLAVAFAGIFGSIGYFGIGTAINKFVSESKQRRDAQEINRVISNALVILVVSGIALTMICFSLSSLVSSSMSYVIKLVSFYIITSMLFGSVYDTLLGFGQGKHIAIVAALEAVMQASVSIMLAFAGFGALAPIFGLIIGFFAGFVVGMYLIFKYNGLSLCMPSSRYLKKILNFSFPVAMSNIAGSLLGSFGLVFLGYFVVPAIIGNIGTAMRVSSLISIIFDSISFALLPAFSAALADKRLSKEAGRFYGYVVYLAIALVSPMLFYMAFFSTPFSYLIFGSGYAYAPLYISIMSIGLLIGVAGTYASTILISANKVRLVFKYNIAVAASVLLLMILLVPYFGSNAYMAIAFLLSPIIADWLFIKELSRMFKVRLRIGKFARLVIANMIASAFAVTMYLFFSGIPLLVSAAAIYLVLYPLLATALRGADRGDVNTIKELSRGIPLVGGALRLLMDYASLMMGS
jgi:O-antigen/teichoic acid export membrane protein